MLLFATLALIACTRAHAADTVIANGPPGSFRLDDRGDALDAHDGDLQSFNGRYYFYGSSYGCGFQWNKKGAPFCGFRVYSSPDLTTWHDEGALFDADVPAWQKRCNGETYGCYRPHVVYNARTRAYVLWINSYDVGVGYHVFTAKTPTGPFVETALPTLAINRGVPAGLNHGDHDVFVDRDGVAYLAYTDWRAKGDIVIERLDADYTSGTGQYVRLGLKSTEAPSLFRRGENYYVTYSDPNCGYCATGTSYLRASSPWGPWSGRSDAADTSEAQQHRGLPLGKDSCGGQPADVATLPGRDEPVFLYQSDRWHHADVNEGLATHYWEPLRFGADGAISPLTCADTFSVPLITRADAPASALVAALELTPGGERVQVVAVVREGGHGTIPLTLFRRGDGDGALQVRVWRKQSDGKPGELLAVRVFRADELSWAPRVQKLPVAARFETGEAVVVSLRATKASPVYGTLTGERHTQAR